MKNKRSKEKLADLRLNAYRVSKAIAIAAVLLGAYWVMKNTELGKRFKLSSELLISLGSGVAIAVWQFNNDKQKQRLETTKEVQEENRQVIIKTSEKLSSAIGILERRIDSALLQISQLEISSGEKLSSIHEIENELEKHEDTAADNRHEALAQDLQVYKELTHVKIELAYLQALVQFPVKKDSPKLGEP